MKIKKFYIENQARWPHMLDEKSTKKVADFLEESELFEQRTEYLRKKYEIPEKGYSLDRDGIIIESLFNEKKQSLDSFFDECQSLTKELKLFDYWWGSVAYYILYSVFFTPEREYLTTKVMRFQDESYNGLHLIINEQLTKTELKRIIDYQWEGIKEEMNLLPSNPKHKMQRIGLAKEIVHLKDKKNKTFSEISDILQIKYVKHKVLYELIDETYVKTLYHRWKNIIVRK